MPEVELKLNICALREVADALIAPGNEDIVFTFSDPENKKKLASWLHELDKSRAAIYKAKCALVDAELNVR